MFLLCDVACVLISELEASGTLKEDLGDEGSVSDDLRREVSRLQITFLFLHFLLYATPLVFISIACGGQQKNEFVGA